MAGAPLQPLVNLLKDEIIGYDVGALDATGLQVLNEPGRAPSVTSSGYCFRGSRRRAR
jgi:transposase